MASKTDIFNMAISHLGVSKEIANGDTENSKEASACRRFYDLARQATLKDIVWPFASKYATLNLIEENPNDDWSYSYRYPSDCLFFRKILSGVRDDTEASKIAYEISQDASGLIILTDLEDATCKYTVDVEDETYFQPDFVMAISYRLAYYIAPRITAGDPFNLGQKAMTNYTIELSKASANAFNEDQSITTQDTASIAARG